MSDVKLFRLEDGSATELVGRPVKLEKKLQALIEQHIDTFLHIRFLATEYFTGKTHSGRIDTLGLDENFCPVIIEYKRSSNANVINQGLFYLDWLMDHKAEFEQLVQKKFGTESSSQIDWSAPRLLCIAEDFTRYDTHAIQQIDRNIELIRYKQFSDDLILLDLVNVVSASANTQESSGTPNNNGLKSTYVTQKQILESCSDELHGLYDAVRDHILDLGDEVQGRLLKYYTAFKRLKNFACVHVQPGKGRILIWLQINPDSVELEDGFTQDKRGIGHYGTGDLELAIQDLDDLEKAKPLIQMSFEEN